jgi:hypothetical protein
MQDRPGQPLDPRFDPEEALWSELIRCEIDSWNPRRLPARFRPRNPRPGGAFWGSLPLVVAVCVLILVVAGLASLSNGVGGVLNTLSGVRPDGAPGGRGPGPSATAQYPAAASGAGVAASSARTSQAAAPTPTERGQEAGQDAGQDAGTASGPRTNPPPPTPEPPAPTPFVPPLPSPLPTIPGVPPLATPAMSAQPPAVLSADQQQLPAAAPSPQA